MFADGHQVQQVLLNLIINAEQAMLSVNGRSVLVPEPGDAEQESVVLGINDDGQECGDVGRISPFSTKEVGKG